MKSAGAPPSGLPDPPEPQGAATLSGRLASWLSRQRSFLSYRLQDASALLSRGRASVRGRGLLPTLRLVRAHLFPTRLIACELLLYTEVTDPDEIHLPKVEARASIIVPVHNQLHFTLHCLYSLSRCGDATPFEVIVIDDASSDASATVLPGIDGLRYQRNEENRGFIDSCNAGAALARAEFLVFLNNDTVVQPGWLDALLQTFVKHPDTGLAGSKLVYPDGRLQEAGGIVFTDGSAANHGRNRDPGDPRYNFVREVDYCSGAALAIRKSLFSELGGFDAHYRPAYYEDTDLAMRVRQRGLKVRYQPASVVVHFEGASSGTDTRRGIKAYQITNQKKFAARWKSVLESSQPPAKKRILVIDAHTPRPDRDSGSVRMVELMGLLLEENCTVDFFSQSLAHDGRYTEALQQLGVQVWWTPWIGQIPTWLAEHGRHFDAIIVSRHYVLSPLLPLLRKLAPQAQIVFDSVDLHFLRESRQAAQTGEQSSVLSAERTRATELELLRAVDKTWVVSAFERELLEQIEPSASIEVVSNIHSISADSPNFADRADLVFVGSFLHLPNLDAARWLLAEIFPIVQRALPSIRLHLVGAEAPASLLEMAQSPGVEIHGHVPDLESLLDRTRIALAPLRYGAGVKGKINQSLARGLPVVATHCAVEGMHLLDGQDVLCADTAQEFADSIIGLYGDEPLWQRLRVAGIANTLRHFSRDAARAVIRPWLDGLRSG